MFGQTPVNRLEKYRDYQMPVGNSGGEAASVRRVVADVAELAELQARLIASDAKCLAESTFRPLLWGAISFTLILGTLPVLLLGIASTLVQYLGWTLAVAQLTVAGAMILCAAIFSAVAMKALRACGPPLRNSLAEFEKNIDTLREMLGGKNKLQSHLEQMDHRKDKK